MDKEGHHTLIKVSIYQKIRQVYMYLKIKRYSIIATLSFEF